MRCWELGGGDDVVGGGWRVRLGRVARENWELYRRHPWMLQVATMSRPPMGPNVISKYDRELRAIDGIGLTDVEMDSVLTLVLGYVQGVARDAAAVSQAERRTGKTDDEWWRAVEPLLGKVFDENRFPTAARVGAAAGTANQAAYDPEQAFEFGLERVLDGIESFVRARENPDDAPRSADQARRLEPR